MILSLNTTMPFILLAALGFFMKRRGMIGDALVAQGNKIIFYFGIPATIFNHVHRADMSEVFDVRFLTFNSLWFVVFFLITWFIASVAMKDKNSVSSFVNSAYRGSLSVMAPPLLVLMFYGAHDPNILPKGILAISVLQILSSSSAAMLFAMHDPAARKKGALGVIVSILKKSDCHRRDPGPHIQRTRMDFAHICGNHGRQNGRNRFAARDDLRRREPIVSWF